MLRKLLFSCSLLIFLNSCDQFFPTLGEMNKKISKLEKNQQVILSKLTTMESKMQGGRGAAPSPNKVYDVKVGDSFVYGEETAPVTIIKWLDFQCPYCAQSVGLVDAIIKKYPKDVKVVYKNFPLSFHKQAKKAAKYALAAEKQGKFLEMYHEIYKDYKKLKANEDYPLELAEKLGLDVAKLKKDLEDPSIEKRITEEVNQLKNSGIPRMSVPKFLINGKEPRGRNIELWSQMIEKELEKAGKKTQG